MPSPLVQFWVRRVWVKSTDRDARASRLPFLRFFRSVMGPQITYIPAARAAASPPMTPQFFMTLYLKEKITSSQAHHVYIQIEEEVTLHRNNPLACQIPNFQVKVIYSTGLCLKTQHISTWGFKTYIRAQPSKSPTSLGGKARGVPAIPPRTPPPPWPSLPCPAFAMLFPLPGVLFPPQVTAWLTPSPPLSVQQTTRTCTPSPFYSVLLFPFAF